MKTPLKWVQAKLAKLRRRKGVVDKYRIDVLEGNDDQDESWFEESQRLDGSISVLAELEKAIQTGEIA